MKEKNIIKKRLDGYIDWWRLRSAYSNYSRVAYVSYYGNVSNYYYDDSNGVVPAFII